VFALLAALTACSPTLNWRELRPDGGGLVVLFPCRPTTESRTIDLEGQGLAMTVWVCEVAGSHYALSRLDAGDPDRARRAEAMLHQAAARTLGASAPAVSIETPDGLKGATAQRLGLAGQTSGGVSVRQQLLTFRAEGTVYQATVFGTQLSEQGVDGFFSGIRLSRRP
jgi:hypothetical protein